jgi:hypothetical protein
MTSDVGPANKVKDYKEQTSFFKNHLEVIFSSTVSLLWSPSKMQINVVLKTKSIIIF